VNIIEFLTARLDEDEQLARAVKLRHQGPWQGRPSEGAACFTSGGSCRCVTTRPDAAADSG